MIKDSNAVSRQCLRADVAYIQCTYLEPYFDAAELRHRRTHYARSVNVRACLSAYLSIYLD